MTKIQKKLWTGLLIMALLSPLGILIPALFNSGGAWGEWGTEALESLIGYMPEGMKKYSGIWNAPVPDYSIAGEGGSMAAQSLYYIASGVLGMLLVISLIYLILKISGKNEE